MPDRRTEVIEKVSALVSRDFAGMWRSAFDAYDTDRDGEIGKRELYRLLDHAGVGNRFTRQWWVGGCIEALDQDGDERISFEEFQEAINSGGDS